MRIGILGGTFDPPHVGHLALARAAIEALELDEVLFMPANRNPIKPPKGQSSAKDRLEMVKRLVHGQPKMAYSDLEITRGGPSYAVDTLTELSMAQPAEYWFLLGADALKDLQNWKQPERLLRLCRLGVASRPSTPGDMVLKIPPEHRDRVDLIPMPPVPVSATEIRDRTNRNQPVGDTVPDKVLQYIREKGLYKNR